MRVRHAGSIVFLAVVVAICYGCKKSSDKNTRSKVISGPIDTNVLAEAEFPTAVSRLHWLGIKGLRADTNSAKFLMFWDQQESINLKAQTLDKLASAPWRLGTQDQTTVTNKSADLLRPLLDDLIEHESFLEIFHPSNRVASLALAIRLDPDKAARWQTNLAAVIQSLRKVESVPIESELSGWKFRLLQQQARGDNFLELLRIGQWTAINFTYAGDPLRASLLSRLRAGNSAFVAGTNAWIEADFDLRRISAGFSLDWDPPAGFPQISLAISGDGQNVLTRSSLRFPKPLPISLEPWSIPTNLIIGPLVRFTAVRGIQQLLAETPSFAGSDSDATPFQAYTWDSAGVPFEKFFALAVSNAPKTLGRLSEHLTNLIAPRLGPGYGMIATSTNGSKLDWTGLGHAAPFMQTETNSANQYVFGGFGPHVVRTNRISPDLLAHILEGTNFVAVDWEFTGESLVHWRYLDDVYRIVFDRHGPRLNDSLSLKWIANNLTNLSQSLTEIKVADPQRLMVGRRSTIGLTAVELDYLANWLEAPDFPSGFSKVMVTNAAPIVRHHPPSPTATNSASSPK